MKTIVGLMMLVLILVSSALCHGIETATASPATRSIDLRQHKNFNPWTTWSKEYKANYTWPQFRSELARLNGKPDSDYALRHIGLGSYGKSVHYTILLPLLNVAFLEKGRRELAQKAQDLEQKEQLLAKKSAELSAEKVKITTVQQEMTSALAQQKKELETKQQELDKLAASNQKSLEALPQEATATDIDQLSQKDKELAEVKMTLGNKIGHRNSVMFWEAVIIISLLVLYFRRRKSRKWRIERINTLEEENESLIKGNDLLASGKDKNAQDGLKIATDLAVARTELSQANDKIEELQDLVERVYMTFILKAQQRKALHGPAEDFKTILRRGRKEGTAIPYCGGYEVNLVNLSSHISECPKCQEVLKEGGIIGTIPNNLPAMDDNRNGKGALAAVIGASRLID